MSACTNAGTQPCVGDFVGTTIHGTEVWIAAVDTKQRLVQIAALGAVGPWLNETQARAVYNYEWGKRTQMPDHWTRAILAGEFEI